MSERKKPVSGVSIEINNVTHIVETGQTEVDFTGRKHGDITDDRAKELMSNAMGSVMGGETVFHDDDSRHRRGRNTARAAFSAARWKSPWVPQGDIDRANRQPYNPDMN